MTRAPKFLFLSLISFLLSCGSALAQASSDARERALVAYRTVFEAEAQRVSMEAERLRAEAGRLEAAAAELRQSAQSAGSPSTPNHFDRGYVRLPDRESSTDLGRLFSESEEEIQRGFRLAEPGRDFAPQRGRDNRMRDSPVVGIPPGFSAPYGFVPLPSGNNNHSLGGSAFSPGPLESAAFLERQSRRFRRDADGLDRLAVALTIDAEAQDEIVRRFRLEQLSEHEAVRLARQRIASLLAEAGLTTR